MDASSSTPTVARRPLWRRLARTTVLLLATAAVLAIIGLWLITRSWFLVGRIDPILERHLGGPVEIGSASIHANDRIVLRDVRLRAPGMAGAAGEVATISRVVITVADVLALDFAVTQVAIEDAHVRISEDRDEAGQFNIMTLDPAVDPSRQGTLPEKISVTSVVLEMGSHDEDGYHRHGERRLAGDMHALSLEPGWYGLLLREVGRETPEAADRPSILIKGRWNAATYAAAVSVDGLVLDDRAMQMCPQLVRVWWEEMNPVGLISGVSVDWSPTLGSRVVINLEDIAMTLPIETEGIWARYRDGLIQPESGQPRMNVSSGTIVLTDASLELSKLVGTVTGTDEGGGHLVEVPYSVKLAIEVPTPPEWDTRVQWVEDVINTAAFELDIRLDDFSYNQEDASDRGVEIPLGLAQVLERFRMTRWDLETWIEVRRAAPTTGEDGTLIAGSMTTRGAARISDGMGAYEKFPYLLDDIEAHVDFTESRVVIDYLNGRGSNNARLVVEGTIEPLPDPGVELTLRAFDVPLDARLADALKDEERVLFESLINHEAFASLQAADLIPTEVDRSRMEDERRSIVQRAAALARDGAGQAERDMVLAEVEQLDRRIACAPFELGGEVDLDLTITRLPGDDQATITTGQVTIDRVGVLLDRFPYPIVVRDGRVEWEHDRLVLVHQDDGKPADGLPLMTPGGGHGIIKGQIILEDASGEDEIRPELEVTVFDDAINTLLTSAIPVGDDLAEGWPGQSRHPVATFLESLNVEGNATYIGSITSDETDRIAYAFDVVLEDIDAHPDAAFARELGIRGEAWPDGFGIEDGEGVLRVTREEVSLIEFEGRHPTGDVRASGLVHADDESLEDGLVLTFDDLRLGRYLLNLVPDSWLERTGELWDRYEPDGRCSADLRFEPGDDSRTGLSLTVTPTELECQVSDERVVFSHVAGTIIAGGETISADDLKLRVLVDDVEHGAMTIVRTGATETDREGLRIDWFGGAFQSPLVREAIWLSGNDEVLDLRDRYDPFGDFDASLITTWDDGFEDLRYTISIIPDALGLRIQDTPILARFDQTGSIELHNGVLTLSGLTADVENGSFQVGGLIDLNNDGLDADLSLSMTGSLRSPEIQSLLPADAVEVLDGLRYEDGSRSELHGARLRLQRPGDGPSMTRFEGQLDVSAARFWAGVPFTEFDGSASIDILHRSDEPPRVTIDVEAHRVRADRFLLTDLTAGITLDETGTVVLVPSIEAWAYGGRLVGSVRSQIDAPGDYDVDIGLTGARLEGLFEVVPGDTVTEAPPSGEVFASLALGGIRGQPTSRRGRGSVRVINGRLAKVLASLQVIQLLQLTLPVEDSFNYANLDFYADGDRLVFERIILESAWNEIAPLQLIGVGEMDFNTYELNTEFRTRTGWNVLRDVAGSIGDRLYVIQVTGNPAAPEARVITLPKQGDSLSTRAAAIRGATETP